MDIFPHTVSCPLKSHIKTASLSSHESYRYSASESVERAICKSSFVNMRALKHWFAPNFHWAQKKTQKPRDSFKRSTVLWILFFNPFTLFYFPFLLTFPRNSDTLDLVKDIIPVYSSKTNVLSFPKNS